MSNALVSVTPNSSESKFRAGPRAQADFIAQLIATREQAPQTRARRRAEPEQAIAAYRSLGQWPRVTGRALSRSL